MRVRMASYNRGDRKGTEATAMTTQVTQRTNQTAQTWSIEGKFFGMIIMAWALLAVVFNLAHNALPQAKNPAAGTAAKTTALSAPYTAQTASLP